jgi:hypothetical protein
VQIQEALRYRYFKYEPHNYTYIFFFTSITNWPL